MAAAVEPHPHCGELLVKGIKLWAVFEEKRGGATVRTVFKIT